MQILVSSKCKHFISIKSCLLLRIKIYSARTYSMYAQDVENELSIQELHDASSIRTTSAPRMKIMQDKMSDLHCITQKEPGELCVASKLLKGQIYFY